MKTNVFSASKKNALLIGARMFLIALAMSLGQAQSSARNMQIVLPEMKAATACLLQDYYAITPLPEGVSSNADVVVTELFGSLPGFQRAHLAATIDPVNLKLNVVLTGYAYEDLPTNTLIGIVTVTESGVQWTFQVWADGGGIVLELDDL